MKTNSAEHIDRTGGSGRGSDKGVVGLRASDADRAATAEVLQRHYAAGRLDAQEFEERVGRCYTAKSVGELDELVVDLPPDWPRSEAREVEVGHAYRGPRQMWRLATVAPIVAALAVVSALVGAHVVWLAWPLAFFVLRARPWRMAGGGLVAGR